VAIAVLIGQHFAAARETDHGAIFLADFVLERRSVTLVAGALARETTQHGHAESAADLDVVPAGKVLLFVSVQPPRHVHVHAADAVAVVARHATESGHVTAGAVAHRIGEVLPDDPGRVGDPVG